MSGGCSIAMFHYYTDSYWDHQPVMTRWGWWNSAPGLSQTVHGRRLADDRNIKSSKVSIKWEWKTKQKLQKITKSSNIESGTMVKNMKNKKNTLAFALEFPACRSNNANSTSWPPMRAEARRTEPSRMWPIWIWAKRRSFEGILGHVTGLLMCQFLNLGHEMNMMHFLGSLWSLWIFMDLSCFPKFLSFEKPRWDEPRA